MAVKITSQLCKWLDIGQRGTLFGGRMLTWIDEAGAIYARKTTGETVVTYRLAETIFKHPVHLNDIVDFYAENPKRGHCSFTFELFAMVGDIECLRTECTFVAIDANNHKVAINWDNVPEHLWQ